VKEKIQFPLDFVPKLKPKVVHLIPSPMLLGAKCTKGMKLEEFNLGDNIGYNSDSQMMESKVCNPVELLSSNNKLQVKRSVLRFVTNRHDNKPVSFSDQKELTIPSPKKKTVCFKAYKLESVSCFNEYDGLQEQPQHINVINKIDEEDLSPMSRKTSILNFMEKRKQSSGDLINLVN